MSSCRPRRNNTNANDGTDRNCEHYAHSLRLKFFPQITFARNETSSKNTASSFLTAHQHIIGHSGPIRQRTTTTITVIIINIQARIQRRVSCDALQHDSTEWRQRFVSSTLVIMRYAANFQGRYTCVADNGFRVKRQAFRLRGLLQATSLREFLSLRK